METFLSLLQYIEVTHQCHFPTKYILYLMVHLIQVLVESAVLTVVALWPSMKLFLWGTCN